jgi:two-component system KDP operon response regulator KdpE
VLEALIRHEDRMLTVAILLREVWDPHRDDARGLRVHIGNLRKKLEVDPDRPRYILTGHQGYRIVINTKDDE